MHDCLLVTEIFRVICEQLASSSTEHRAALSAVARTCRILKEPALDALWAELDKLGPLIRCLPKDLWLWDDPESPERCLIICRPLRAADWNLFRYYAHRVRVLKHEHASDRIAPNTFSLLGFPNHTAPLFPNLHRVHWTDNRKEVYPFLDVVCSSHLKELSMNLPDLDSFSDPDSMIARSFLHSIVGRCITLKRLEVRDEDDNPDYEDAVSEVVSSLPKLEVLNCGYLKYKAIAHLDQLESLRELSFTVAPSYDYKGLFHYSLFERLSYLGLASAETLGVILPLLQYIPRLPPFFIFSALRSTVGEIRNVIFHIVRAGNADFDDVNIDVQRGIPEWEDPPEFLIFDDIEPLSRFKNIRTLILCTGQPFCLDDDDVKMLSSYWPKMDTFNISGTTGWGGLTRVTLKGVLSIIENCRYLRNLGIVFDARARKGLSAGRPGGGISSGLSILMVGDSPIDNPAEVAMILSDLFPNVETLQAWEDTTWGHDDDVVEEQREKWEEATKLLIMFASIRRQERAWVQT